MQLAQALIERINWLERHPKVRVIKKEIRPGADSKTLAEYEGKLDAGLIDFYRIMNGLEFVWGFKSETIAAGSIRLNPIEKLLNNSYRKDTRLKNYLRVTYRSLDPVYSVVLGDFYDLEVVPDICSVVLIAPKKLGFYDFMFLHLENEEQDQVVATSFKEYLEKAIEYAFLIEWQTESSEIHIHYRRLFEQEELLTKEQENILELLETKQQVNVKLAFSLLEAVGLPFNISLNEELVKWPNRVLLCLEHEFFELLHPKKLNLNRMKQIPESIKGLKKLEELSLNVCFLNALPESLGELKNLKKLYLNNNHFASIPDLILNMQGLEVLRIASNKLKKIPDAIAQLKNLQELNISRNPLETINKEIWKLSQLKSLDIRKLKVEELPAEIAQLKSLEKLNLSGNPLTEYPEILSELKNLKTLDISSTKLKEIPESIGKLSQLEFLHINGNPIEKLPEEVLLSMPHLKLIELPTKLRLPEGQLPALRTSIQLI